GPRSQHDRLSKRWIMHRGRARLWDSGALAPKEVFRKVDEASGNGQVTSADVPARLWERASDLARLSKQSRGLPTSLLHPESRARVSRRVHHRDEPVEYPSQDDVSFWAA